MPVLPSSAHLPYCLAQSSKHNITLVRLNFAMQPNVEGGGVILGLTDDFIQKVPGVYTFNRNYLVSIHP